MEQIAIQATDLRFLTQAPIAAAAAAAGSGSPSAGLRADETGQSPHSLGNRASSRPPLLLHSGPSGDNATLASFSPGNTHNSSSRGHPGHPGHNNQRRTSHHAHMSTASQEGPGYGGDGTGGDAFGANHGTGAGGRRTPAKRRAEEEEDDSGRAKQQRSKRNRYISIACNECKRRKIKCNGETPCQRCGNLNLACLYSANCCSNNFRDSDEFKQMSDTIHHLGEQMDTLFQTVDALRRETQRLAPLQDRILPVPASTVPPSPSSSSHLSVHKPELAPIRAPRTFRGPTSTAFTVGVAKNTLRNMGYSAEVAEDQSAAGGSAMGETPQPSPSIRPSDQFHMPPLRSPLRPAQLPPSADPLWELSRDEMVRLCHVHEDEVGIMYPVIRIEAVIEHAQSLSSWMESARMSSGFPPPGYDEAMADTRTLLLKIILCCALAVEEHGHSERAIRLYDSIEPTVNCKLMTDPSDIANLPFLALVAGYRFLSNDEVLAWRIMGQVSRHCLEQGLHRREGVDKIADPQERRNAINTFWAAYVLDRRWSFSTGLPYVLHDDKIDPGLPYPSDYPYLVAMITYSRLAAKVWKVVDSFEPTIIRDLKGEEAESLDQEILRWYDTVPESVKINNLDRDLPLPSTPSYNLQRLQIWTRLRLNQIRIWLLTPVLHSASSINDNMTQAQRVVDLAKETIRYLSRLNNGSNLYLRFQVFYHQFLTSAIAVLFLASTHQPVQFSAQCRQEFYMALNLIKDMSAKSWVSQRLWRTIGSLKAYAPRLGLQQQEDDEVRPGPMALSGYAPTSSSNSNDNNDNNNRGNNHQPYYAPHAGPAPSSSGSSVIGPSRSSAGDSNNNNNNNWPAPLPPPFPGTPNSPAAPQPGRYMSVPGHSRPSVPPPALSAPPLSGHNSPAASTPVGQPPGPGRPMATTTPTAGTPELTNGLQIQTEMTRIYEEYLSMSGGPPVSAAAPVHDRRFAYADSHTPIQGMRTGCSDRADGMTFGETVYEQLKNMF
ncbi:fungal specific transcription factor [Niveomyces insectorum RCEF 264]|uniref:Fungal specific transcription factor n=1 Tax=Niveomyces insectorum RCEF 264 TaxID=1081102 RepID=A0A167RJ82_9HYPO|nr:fungal specific transcription factor [Niveomyces insectorum RCEF 264]